MTVSKNYLKGGMRALNLDYDIARRMILKNYKQLMHDGRLPTTHMILNMCKLDFEVSAYDIIYNLDELDMSMDDVHHCLQSIKAIHIFDGDIYNNAQLKLFEVWTQKELLLANEV